jgi:hypothetical protein
MARLCRGGGNFFFSPFFFPFPSLLSPFFAFSHSQRDASGRNRPEGESPGRVTRRWEATRRSRGGYPAVNPNPVGIAGYGRRARQPGM